MKRKLFLSFIFLFIIFLSFMIVPSKKVNANTPALFSGEGTEDNPYLIYTADDLITFSNSVNSGNSYYKHYIQLANDIDMSGREFCPIGIYGEGNYFWGTFDGNGHVITNLVIYSYEHAGLFGQLAGTVMNLGIESGSISGNGCIAAIAPHSASKSALIINCYNKASVVSLYSRAGGIVDDFGGTVLNCWSDCELSGVATGGIISKACTSKNYCYSTNCVSPTLISNINIFEVSSDYLYSIEMSNMLNDNLSNNLSCNLRSRIDVTKLNRWSFSDGKLCFSDEKAELYFTVKYKPLIEKGTFFIVLVLFFAMFYFCLNTKKSVLDKTQRIIIFSCSFIISSFLSFIVMIIIFRGSMLNQVLFKDSNDTFMDYYNSVYDTADRHPYDHYVIYPPLCNLIYYIASRFVSANTFQGKYEFPGGGTIRNLQGIKLSFVLYSIFILILLLVSLNNLLDKKNKIIKYLIYIAVLCSFPLVYAFERGNIILLSFAFILFFVSTYNNDNKFLRELGLLSLAFGGVLKIYPAIFGIILLQDKRFKDALRAIAYGVLLFFVPFVFFDGKNGMILFFRNMFGFAGASGNSSLKFSLNPVGVYAYISEISGIDFANVKWLSIGIGLLLIIFSLFESHRWKKYCMITCSMICIMPTVGTYVMIYLIIPWIMQFTDKDKAWKPSQIYYNSLFVILFTTLPLGFILRSEYFDISYILPICSAIYTFIVSLMSFSLIIGFIKNRLSKKYSILISSALILTVCIFSFISTRMVNLLHIENNVFIDLSDAECKEKNEYILSGLDLSTEGYTWTNAVNIVFKDIEVESGKDYVLTLNVNDTYNSDYLLQEIVVYNRNKEIYRCSCQGQAIVKIPLDSENERLQLRISLPNAVKPPDVDRKYYGLQLESIEFSPSENI